MFTEPKAGWRDVSVRERRTKLDWAHEVRRILDGRYAGVPKITLVMDNLNTHTTGSLYLRIRHLKPSSELPASFPLSPEEEVSG